MASESQKKKEEEESSLFHLFSKVQEQYLQLEEKERKAGSANPEYQASLAPLISSLLTVSKKIDAESIFSPNEKITEVVTTSIPFLLVPFYTADVHTKMIEKRLVHLGLANRLFRNFLEECQKLGLIPSGQTTEKVLESLAKDRTFRIELMKKEMAAKKRQKELLEKRKEIMRKKMIREEDEDALLEFDEEDDNARDVHLLMVEMAIMKSYGEVNSIKQELELLRFAEKRKLDAERGKPQQNPTPKPDPGIQMYQLGDEGGITHLGKAPSKLTTQNLPGAQPQESHNPAGSVVQNYNPAPGGSVSVSTLSSMTKREELKAQVFQPGWTQPSESLQSYCDRMMPHAITGGGNEPTEEDLDDEAEEKERRIERDDPELLAKEREWDEFKEDNPTGSGNRLRQG